MNYFWELGKQKCVENEHDIYYPQSEITYGSGEMHLMKTLNTKNGSLS